MEVGLSTPRSREVVGGIPLLPVRKTDCKRTGERGLPEGRSEGLLGILRSERGQVEEGRL